MKKSKSKMKEDTGLVLAATGGGLASAVIAKKVPSKFTGVGLLVAGVAGGILLQGKAQAACLGMIPVGAVSTLNQFVAPKVAAVSEFLPAIGSNGMAGLGNAEYARLLQGYDQPYYDELEERPSPVSSIKTLLN